MRKPHYLAAAAAVVLTVLDSTPAFAESARALPARPQVTAATDLKQLVFDWDRVPGATHYQLRVNPTGSDGYSPLGNRIPPYRTRARIDVAAHLLDWQRVSFVVSACNRAGCRDSAPVFVDHTFGTTQSATSRPAIRKRDGSVDAASFRCIGAG